MTTVGLQIGVFVTLGVKVGTSVVVVLDEEVGPADTNPEEVRVFAEQVVDLLVTVSVDVGESIGISLLLDYGSGERPT